MEWPAIIVDSGCEDCKRCLEFTWQHIITQLIRRGQLCILEYVGRSIPIRLHTFLQSKDFVSSGLNSLNLDGPVFPVLRVVSYDGTAVQTAVSLSFVYVGCVSCA